MNGGALAKCSGAGMALTGFTRTGECVDQDDDATAQANYKAALASAAGVDASSITLQISGRSSQTSRHRVASAARSGPLCASGSDPACSAPARAPRL